MTQEQFKNFQQAAQKGTMADAENPIFIFSNINSSLLLKISSGELDAKQLARIEMMNRGLSMIDGSFVGYAKAEELFNSTL